MPIAATEHLRKLLIRGIEQVRGLIHTFDAPWVLQITRAVDAYHLLSSPPDPRGISPEFDQLFSAAAGPLIRLSQASSGKRHIVPPRVLSDREGHLFPQLVEVLGKIANTWMALELIPDGLFRVSKKSEHYYRIVQNSGEMAEYVEVLDYLLNSDRNSASRAGEAEDLEKIKPLYRWQMEVLARGKLYPGELSVDTGLRNVGQWYLRRARVSLGRAPGADELIGDHSIAGLKFRVVRQVLEGLSALASIHADIDLIRSESSPNIGLGGFTYYRPAERLAQEIAEVTGMEVDEAWRALMVIAEPAVDWPADRAIVATVPALLQANDGDILPVLAGLETSPFDPTLRHFERAYQEDFFRGVNLREDLFIQDLYHLFPSVRYVLSESPLNLRENGKTVTDIDLAIFDLLTGELALIQLKWQSPFGRSMNERRSKARNFGDQCAKWARTVESWLSRESCDALVGRFVIGRERKSVAVVRLFAIGRNFSRASGITRMDRTLAIGNWSQFQESWRNACLESKPISALFELLRVPVRHAELGTHRRYCHTVNIDGVTIELERTVIVL